MQPYKWTVKQVESGQLFYLIHIFEDMSRDRVLLARKSDGKIGIDLLERLSELYVLVEEEATGLSPELQERLDNKLVEEHNKGVNHGDQMD